MSYISKYVAKETEHPFRGYDGSSFLDNGAYLHAGRFWGFHNADCIPWAVKLYIVLHGVNELNFARAKALLASEWEGLNSDPLRGGVVWSEIAETLFDQLEKEINHVTR